MRKKLNKLIDNSKNAKEENMLAEYLKGRIINQSLFDLQLSLINVHDKAIDERIGTYKTHQWLKKEY